MFEKKNKLYVEPSIRVIAGVLILSGLLIDSFFPHSIIFFVIVAFVGLNFTQSGFTGFCGLEKILKNVFHFRCEMDEIKELGEQIGRTRESQENIKILNLLEEVIVELDSENRIVKVTDGFSKILNCSFCLKPSCTDCKCDTTCYGKSFFTYVINDDVEELQENFKALYKNKGSTNTVNFKIQDLTGKEKIIEGKFLHLSDEEGRFPGIRGVLRDITESISHEKQIIHMSLHDNLTGLPNRILFTDRLEQTINISRRNNSIFALIFIDIDSFQKFNETHGYKLGDELLRLIAKNLKDNMRDMDTLSRWGGDEFVILLKDFNSIDIMRRTVSIYFQKIVDEIMKLHPDDGIHMSAGISFFPDDASSSEQLIKNATRALEKARIHHVNSFKFFSDISGNYINNHNDDEGSIAWKMEKSIEDNVFQVYFQPIINAKTNKIVSVEALARWHDETYGWINPIMFIKIAENLGLIQRLGKKIFEISFTKYLENSYLSNNISLAVNISQKQLMAPYFENDFIELLEQYGIAPEMITLEITEGVSLLGMGRARESLKVLTEYGCRVSLDDFGSGYSSISALRELPINELKIDGIFINRVLEEEGALIVKAIIDMGHAMGLKIVCESVENIEIAEKLREMGADFLQGFLFSKPVEEILLNDANLAYSI